MDYAVNTYDLYRDIQQRTGGEIYIGVLGPVRTGKSTFIKRFMDEMVLPYMEDEHARMRAQDELPQSAGGKTITTTEPKFIPNEAAKVRLNDDIEVSVRLIDCVGYMIDGAAGHMEEDAERMVKTPWSEEEIPFTQAAEIGTDKVMRDHSTIGLVITTDGSIGELPRSNYLGAEEKTILALKKSGKPFLVLVNSQKPYSEETRQVAEEIGKKYDVAVMPVNCEQLKKEDINRLLEKILYEFPLTAVEFYFPKWMDMLPVDHAVKQDLLRQIRELMNSYDRIRDVAGHPVELQGDYIQSCKMEPVQLWNGIVPVQVGIDDRYYYEMLSGMLGENVEDEYQLLNKLKELAEMKKEYTKVQDALSMVKIKGYGVVTPDREDIALEKPELIRHGNKFGVKIKASSPSIHMIRANIETEIAPIVGTEQQAQDLIHFIDQAEAEHGIWETNIFGKTVEQLVDDGITTKVASIGEESQLKLQDTMQKIVNDKIFDSMNVTVQEMPVEEAKKLGAMALFGEKYGKVVRVVDIEGWSTEFCGGTHVKNTAQIGGFKIVSESSVAAGIRRIEAVTGRNLLIRANLQEAMLHTVANTLKANNVTALPVRAEAVMAENKALAKELEEIKAQVAASKVTSLFDNAEEIGGVKIASAYFTGTTGDTLRGMCDTIRDKAVKPAVAVLVGKAEDKITMAVTVTKQAQEKGLKAGALVKEIAAIAGGKGGGKPDFAMAGLKDETKIDEALAAVSAIVKKALGE